MTKMRLISRSRDGQRYAVQTGLFDEPLSDETPVRVIDLVLGYLLPEIPFGSLVYKTQGDFNEPYDAADGELERLLSQVTDPPEHPPAPG